MWSADEETKLRELRIDPAKSDRARLKALVEHFRSGGKLFDVTDDGNPVYASQELARKIKDATQRGRLGWLSTSREDIQVSEDPALASREHWVHLKNAARILGDVTSSAPPFAQLLDFPWRMGPEYRDGLVTNFHSGSVEISLGAEQSLYLGALKEHLHTHRVWDYLDSWISQVQELMSELKTFCELVDVRSHVEGKTRITEEQAKLGAEGLTEFFARSITLDAAERMCGISRATHSYEQRSNQFLEMKTLLLHRNSSSFVTLASSADSEDLEQLQHHHETMRDRMANEPEGQRVVATYRRLGESGKPLSAEFLWIANLVELPGSCSLAGGATLGHSRTASGTGNLSNS